MPFLVSVALVPKPAEFDLANSLAAFNCLSNEYSKTRHCISDQAAIKQMPYKKGEFYLPAFIAFLF